MHAHCCRDQDLLPPLSFNFPLESSPFDPTLQYRTLPCGALLPAYLTTPRVRVLRWSPSSSIRSWRCIRHPTPLRPPLLFSFQHPPSRAIHIFLFLLPLAIQPRACHSPLADGLRLPLTPHRPALVVFLDSVHVGCFLACLYQHPQSSATLALLCPLGRHSLSYNYCSTSATNWLFDSTCLCLSDLPPVHLRLDTMDSTPQSMRSPVSPYQRHSKQSFSSQRPAYYPMTPQPEPNRNRGLGIFACGLQQQQQQPQSSVQQLPPSPQPSDGWSHPSMMEQDFPQSTQPPDIFSAAYDPFSGFSTAPNTGMMSGSSPEAPGLVYCHTPPSTNLPSHRSSVSSSYAPSEAFSQHGADFTYTPRVKVEDASEWYPTAGNEHALQRNLTTQCLSPYSAGVSPATGDDVYRNAEWPKSGGPAYPIDLHHSEDHRLPQVGSAPILSSVNRIKKKRQRTTPEEATHECHVCGKLFKRSYNWKSHMETHNPDRKYPHPCTATVGDTPCTKKFQRKTDLDRHYDSVS